MSSRKAFLCSFDGTYNFPMLPKVTTIGRENCDIVINSQNLDTQHAVIEYVENEGCFILQDLNTVNGTYINDCRVQNAAVRLAEQDVLRFGFNGVPFQFIVQEQIQTVRAVAAATTAKLSISNLTPTTFLFKSIPPINLPKQGGNQQLQLINQTIPSRGSQFQANNNAAASSIWINIPATNAQLVTMNNNNSNNNNSLQNVVKPPASLRTRPGSAQNTVKKVAHFPTPQLNGWVKGYNNNNNQQLTSQSEYELNRVQQQQQQVCSSDSSELHSKLYQLEKEMKLKNVEIKDLTDKLNSIQSQQNSFTGSVQTQEFTLRNELEQTKRDKSIATGLINTMQKDLTTKDATISKLAREVENFKKDIRERDAVNRDLVERLNSLKDFKKAEEERQNKEKELLVLKNKIRSTENKVIDLNNHVLQIKSELEESQRQLIKNTQNEKNLKDELEHVKIQYLDMQRAERTVRIDLEQSRRLYEKFRNLIIQTLYSTPGIGHPNGEVTDEDLIATWKKLIEERTKLKECVASLKDKLKVNEDYHTETIESVKNLENQLSKIQTSLYKNNGRRTDDVKATIVELETMELHDNLIKLREPVLELLRNELKWQADIEDTLRSFEIDTGNNYSMTVLMKSIHDKYTELEERRVGVQRQLEETELSHADRVEKLTLEKDIEIETKVELCRSGLVEKYTAEIDKINKENEEKLNSLLSTSQLSQDEIAQELSSLKSQLIETNAQISSLSESLQVANSSIDLLKSQLAEKQEEFNAKTVEFEREKAEASLKYSQDLEIYKEQIRQHSLTIVGLEKDLHRARDREIDCLNQMEALKKKQSSSEAPAKAPPQKVTPPPTPPRIDSDILALEKTIENLRNECSVYTRKISEQDEVIKVLRRDVISANAKLTDVHSEMSDRQKRELEKNRALIHEQTRELADSRSQLAKLSQIVDDQTRQIDSFKVEIGKARALAEKYRLTAEENGNLVLELKSKLDSGSLQLKKIETIRHEEGKITTELTAIGAQCRGERHEQVITRQREALNELRQRVKTLEQSRPLLPAAQQQQQQQIMLLKKQLAEFRANQALTEDIAKQANLSRGNDDNLLMLEEKTAHYDTQSALDYSEETYLTLLRSIASMLDLSEIEGLKPMLNLPADERERLLNERNRAIDIICSRLKEQKEALVRKEKLLQDYELDLAKLRQAEFLLQKKSEQLDEAQLSSRNKDDELELLKESLRNARFHLDQEKQVNTTIKQKKPLSSLSMSTDRIRKNSTDTLHHHCPPDSETHVREVKRSMNEKLKKKDYELKILKQELRSKHDELSEVSNRLKIHDKGQDLFS